jgi:hypothetical protein
VEEEEEGEEGEGMWQDDVLSGEDSEIDVLGDVQVIEQPPPTEVVKGNVLLGSCMDKLWDRLADKLDLGMTHSSTSRNGEISWSSKRTQALSS